MTKTRWGVVIALILTGMVAAMQVGKVAIALPLRRDGSGHHGERRYGEAQGSVPGTRPEPRGHAQRSRRVRTIAP